ncbi:uncharacterized protein LOC110834265 [Zootermopsis nevadensis]|nr:uncharacterized protein LOC110834265 [Zootermopsis nevadensis]
MQGELYEIKFATLLFIRGLNRSENFSLACNMHDACDFDDVVFKFGHQTLFIQLKHKSNTEKKIKQQQLISEKGNFSLVRYFKSYCEMKKKLEYSKDLQYCGTFNDFSFIVYTNAVISERLGNDVDETDWHNILKTGGRCISFNEDISLMRCITDSSQLSDFKEFLSRLLFFTGQAAQQELDDLINQELKCLYGTSVVYNDFLEQVKKWWQERKCFLTNENPFWKKIFKDRIDNISEKMLNETEALSVKFKKDEHALIRTYRIFNQLLHVIPEDGSECVILSCLKVHHSLSNESHLFVDGTTLQSRWEEVVAIWSRFCDILVVVETGAVDMDTLVGILLKNPSKRLVFVAGTVAWNKPQPRFTTFRDHVAIRQLDEESQAQILDALVRFQGYDVSLGAVTDGNHEFVPADIIVQLSTHKLVLGDVLTGDLEYYIPRTLQHTVQVVKDQILFHRATDSSVTLAVSGLSYPELQQLMSTDTEMSDQRALGNDKCKIEVISTEDEFLKLTESCETVHWLHRDGNVFICRQSWGNMSLVSKYLSKFENVESVMDVPYSVTLVSAEPGMGKSTLLTHLALGTKEADPATWVIRVNLTDFTQQLVKLKETLQPCDVIEFLLQASKIIEKWRPLFKWKLTTLKNVCVLFDGYDEVSPTHANKVALMLKFLQANRLQKLWVTTRPVMKEKLERELSTRSVTLQPFLMSDQRNFLEKFWKRSMPDVEEHILNNFIKKLLQLTTKNFSDRDRHFMGIPLQSMLLAETFEKNLRTSSGLPQKFNLYQLYSKFLERKLKIFFDKNDMDVTKPVVGDFYNKHKQEMKENHMISALFMLLPLSDIEMFPQSEIMTNSFKSFIDSVQKGNEQTGIIKQIFEGKPMFIHRTFGEYFCALWFAENFKIVQSYVNIKIFDPNFQVVWNFFNQILAQKFPLHLAVLSEEKVLVDTLLSEENLDVNSQDDGGRTALHLAVMSLIDDDNRRVADQIQIITALLRHGADPSIKDKVLCWPPLRIAERIREWLVVDLLLKQIADTEDLVLTAESINNDDEKYIQNVLIFAARHGLVHLVSFMLKHGIDVGHAINVLYEDSDCAATMLHEAAQHDQVELVQFLLDRNANTETRDSRYERSALMWAAKQGNFRVVDVLTKKNADVNMCDMRGYTALLIATKNKRWDVAKLLLERDADVRACDWSGSNVLHFAADSGQTEFVAYLLDKGQIDIECHNKYQQTPLWLAAQSGRLQVSQLLLDRNANLHVQDLAGCTPLHVAAANGHEHIVQLLLQHGANPSADDVHH